MENRCGILYLDRKDLNLEGRRKDIKDIEFTDIANSIKPFREAEMVFFIDKSHMKILKCRYKIVE